MLGEELGALTCHPATHSLREIITAPKARAVRAPAKRWGVEGGCGLSDPWGSSV